MALPKSVTLCECWTRDGLQSIAKVIPTSDKLEMLHRFQAAGVRKMEVTSFSHPKLLPQFADCVEVLKGLDRRPGVSYVVVPARRTCPPSQGASAPAAGRAVRIVSAVTAGPWAHVSPPGDLPQWISCDGFGGLIAYRDGAGAPRAGEVEAVAGFCGMC